ncbi:hypothetical protein HY030_00560 [Candidatus Gottesmanbacteria bacterium]|nr:hypothetical protein [Candidatus Gottesmanbacteria bacterium]
MLSQKIIIEKGKNIYYKIRPQLKKKYEPGNYITVEIKSGKFFVGKSPLEAIDKAKRQFPHSQFFMAQVGRAAGILK